MKKLIILSIFVSFLSIASAPFIFIYILNHGNPIMNHVIGKEGKEYLKAGGYSNKDILKQAAYPNYQSINRNYFNTIYQVVFKDEPEMTYYYGKEKYFGDIVQFCEKDTKEGGIYTKTITTKTEHSEASCISMNENRISGFQIRP
ncbi:DUF3139 domain-containing protein [Falsibacillus pallidus]|uniref:Uncharacterized protein DUF3139 n=1 Tax=Falsibacillus pallidus TaxID=493781 RepID=A0A370G814_9BACI|nr:DUF3139 domain-containing protein [Falsibacillus pallidus]RDI39931.1 uncharacterized protein DUF3139 [Falsibacillus pallidus]